MFVKCKGDKDTWQKYLEERRRPLYAPEREAASRFYRHEDVQESEGAEQIIVSKRSKRVSEYNGSRINGTGIWESEYGLRNPSCTKTQTFVIHHLLFTTTYLYMQNTKIIVRRPPQTVWENCKVAHRIREGLDNEFR